MLCVTLAMLSTSARADKGMSYWLNRLDESLAHRAEYEQMHLDRIERLKTELKQASEDDKFEICYSLFDDMSGSYKSSLVICFRHYDSLNIRSCTFLYFFNISGHT